MINLYVETSAVVAWLLGESTSQIFADFVGHADHIATSQITFIETERALIRSVHSNTISAAERNALRGLLARVTTEWHLLEVTKEVQSRAREPFPVEPVRTLDAIHLATALEWSKIYFDLQIFSHDKRILANAKPLGIPSVMLKD